MDKLKDFIDNNRQAFDDISLPAGHTDRFKEKLNKRQKTLNRRKIIWSVAAASVIGLLFTFYTQFRKEHIDEVCELSTEIREVKMYYNMQITATVTKMEELYKQNQSPGNLDLLKQTQDVIASNLDFENRILPSLPCNEAALFAMNQHYDASLEGMNILFDQMQRTTNENDINN